MSVNVGVVTRVTVNGATADFQSANVYESLDEATSHAADYAAGAGRGIETHLRALLQGEARRRDSLAAGVAAAEPEAPGAAQEPAGAANVAESDPNAAAHAESLRTVLGGALANSHASAADDVTAEKRL